VDAFEAEGDDARGYVSQKRRAQEKSHDERNLDRLI
jgi:hypothetical protein